MISKILKIVLLNSANWCFACAKFFQFSNDAVLAAVLCSCFLSPAFAGPLSCDSRWYGARLTNYESYPAPGSEECVANNGCAWAGQFFGLAEVYDEEWVADHNIVAVHLKDWEWLGMKVLDLRQGNNELRVLTRIVSGVAAPIWVETAT